MKLARDIASILFCFMGYTRAQQTQRLILTGEHYEDNLPSLPSSADESQAFIRRRKKSQDQGDEFDYDITTSEQQYITCGNALKYFGEEPSDRLDKSSHLYYLIEQVRDMGSDIGSVVRAQAFERLLPKLLALDTLVSDVIYRNMIWLFIPHADSLSVMRAWRHLIAHVKDFMCPTDEKCYLQVVIKCGSSYRLKGTLGKCKNHSGREK